MKELIARNTPELADYFTLESLPAPDGCGVYEYEKNEQGVTLRGDSTLSLAMAYYDFLQNQFGWYYGWCGKHNPTVYPKKFPKSVEKVHKEFPKCKRMFLHPNAFSISACWWTWERWEQEIDFMAMQGINMPLMTVGSETVWYKTLRDMGLSMDYTLNALSGPAFWSRQLAGQLDSYYPPVDPFYLKGRAELGKKIMERMQSLGMTPVVAGYNPTIPRSVRGLIRDVKAYPLPSWCGFQSGMILDPDCDAFTKIGELFLKNQKELVGEAGYYLSSPLYKMNFPAGGDDFARRLGEKLYQLHGENAVWVLPGDTVDPALTEKVPADKVLYLDYDGSGAARNAGYNGRPFVSGVPTATAGRNALHGDVKALAQVNFPALQKEFANCAGTGFFPEGLEQNPLLTGLSLDYLTRSAPVDLKEYLPRYARLRYGSDEACLVEGLQILVETCYAKGGTETGSPICRRPNTVIENTAPYDEIELQYDNAKMYAAAEKFLSAEQAGTEGYRFDACDVLRQAMSNSALSYQKAAVEGFRNRDSRLFERGSNDFLYLLEDMDRLLATVPQMTLLDQLEQAKKASRLDADTMNFELNVLVLYTCFGGFGTYLLHDYVWREWSGIAGNYAVRRWRAMFEFMAKRFKKRRAVSLETKEKPMGRSTIAGNKTLANMKKLEENWLGTFRKPKPSEEDTIEVAKELYKKYDLLQKDADGIH